MKETIDTLGHQKKTNYALNQPDKTTFIEAVTSGLTPPPGYFGMNVAMNKKGYTSFEKVLDKSMQALSPDAFEIAAEETGALILDTRDNNVFWKAFVPQSINIGINGDFAPWVGAMLVNVKQPILLVTDDNGQQEVITRLSRVGFDNVIGYLEGGINAWLTSGKETDSIHRITAVQFAKELKEGETTVLDVRKIS